MITVEKIYYTLKNEQPEIKVPESLANGARLAIDRMISVSSTSAGGFEPPTYAPCKGRRSTPELRGLDEFLSLSCH